MNDTERRYGPYNLTAYDVSIMPLEGRRRYLSLFADGEEVLDLVYELDIIDKVRARMGQTAATVPAPRPIQQPPAFREQAEYLAEEIAERNDRYARERTDDFLRSLTAPRKLRTWEKGYLIFCGLLLLGIAIFLISAVSK